MRRCALGIPGVPVDESPSPIWLRRSGQSAVSRGESRNPCSIQTADSVSIPRCRRARETSASIIPRSTAWVERRSSQRTKGRSSSSARMPATRWALWAREPRRPSRCRGRPTTSPTADRSLTRARRRSTDSVGRATRIVSTATAMHCARSETATPTDRAPRSSPSSGPSTGNISGTHRAGPLAGCPGRGRRGRIGAIPAAGSTEAPEHRPRFAGARLHPRPSALWLPGPGLEVLQGVLVA